MYYVGSDGKVRNRKDGRFAGVVRLTTGRELSVNAAYMKVFFPHVWPELDDGGKIPPEDLVGVTKLMKDRSE